MSSIIRAPKRMNFKDDPIMVELTTGAPGEDNLTCSIVVNQKVSGNDVYVAKLTPTYNKDNIVTVKLNSLFDFSPPIPIEAMAGPAKYYSSNWGVFNLVHADRYGTPPTEDATAQSDDFYVIRGGSSFFYGFGPTATSDARSWFLLHSYFVNGNRTFDAVKKVVAPDQPEPIYFWCNNESAVTINWSATIYTSSGLNDSKSGSFNLAGRGVWNVFLSYNDLGSTFENVIGYDLELTAGGHTETIRYIVDDAPNDYEHIILYENGCGGMETARFAGRHKYTAQATAQQHRRTIWSGFSFKDGQTVTHQSKGGKIMELNSGYYPREYIEHLGNLIFSDVWLVDRIRQKLIRYNVVSKNVTMANDSDLVHNLTIQIKPATELSSLNTF